MSEKEVFKRFQKLFDKADLLEMSKDIIYEDNGKYILLETYEISKSDKGFTLHKNGVHMERVFCNARNAIVYATLDKRNKIMDAKKVVELDRVLEDSNNSMELHKKLADRAKDLDTKTIYLAKLQEAKLKKDHINEQLDDYIIEVKKWQNARFAQAAK